MVFLSSAVDGWKSWKSFPGTDNLVVDSTDKHVFRSDVFDASQYAFFGEDVVEEVELGGLDDDDEEEMDMPRATTTGDDKEEWKLELPLQKEEWKLDLRWKLELPFQKDMAWT
ncbi:hypothetical protein ACFE04_007605 [Oxalis oulophora]